MATRLLISGLLTPLAGRDRFSFQEARPKARHVSAIPASTRLPTGNMVYEYPVQPAEFTTLETGGPDHDFMVEAIIFQGGRQWVPDGKTPRNFIRHRFNQIQKTLACLI